ncbi:hypothetical protein AAKU67_002173 [Oxalobacteraceae bacterium GrIS 2.11]
MQKFLIALILLAISMTLAQTASSQPGKPQYKLLTDDKYDGATDFSEGLAAVKVNHQWGFIDRTGKMVIPAQFNPWQQQFNARFSEGLVAVSRVLDKPSGKEIHDPFGAKWGFADKTGKVVIAPRFDGDYYSPPHFANGLAVISGRFIGTTIKTAGLNTKYGYIDKTGKFVIPQIYDDALDFYEDLASVKLGDKYGFIDKTGKLVIPAMYDAPSYFKDGIAIVVQNKISFAIDKQNKKVLEKGFSELSPFFEGLARFEENDKIGFIDIKGNVKIKPTLDFGNPQSQRMMYFSEGLCIFEDGASAPRDKQGNFHGKFGYINKDGKVAIPAQFDYAGPFKNGLAIVSQSGYYGYIDKTGKFVIQPVFANAGYFIDGIARVSGGGGFADYKYRFIKLN